MKKLLLVISLFLCFSLTCNAEVKSGSVEAKYKYSKDSKFYKTEIEDGKAKMLLEDYKMNITSDEDNLDIIIIPVKLDENKWLKDILKDKNVDNIYYVNAYDKDGKISAKGIYIFKYNKETKYIRTNEDKLSSVKYSKDINLSLRDESFYIIEDNIDNSPSTGDKIIMYIGLGIVGILGMAIVAKKFFVK